MQALIGCGGWDRGGRMCLRIDSEDHLSGIRFLRCDALLSAEVFIDSDENPPYHRQFAGEAFSEVVAASGEVAPVGSRRAS